MHRCNRTAAEIAFVDRQRVFASCHSMELRQSCRTISLRVVLLGDSHADRFCGMSGFFLAILSQRSFPAIFSYDRCSELSWSFDSKKQAAFHGMWKLPLSAAEERSGRTPPAGLGCLANSLSLPVVRGWIILFSRSQEGMSMRSLLCLTALFSVLILPGCHCCRCTENYADVIDDIADHDDFGKGLDHCYCERLDVTRWCMNRRCPPSHCRQCR